INNGYLYFTSHPNIPANTGNIETLLASGIGPIYDFEVETSISTDRVMGLVFGQKDTVKGFSFKIDLYGRYSLYDEGSTNIEPLAIIDWRKSDAICLTCMNVLKIEQIGTQWNGYINGLKVFSMTARTVRGNNVGYIMQIGTNGQADYID